ncbi:unnamed protein product [Withania somnifera]
MEISTIILIASAICLLSLLGNTRAIEEAADSYQFILEGMVFCDLCRSEFKTNLSEPIAYARVGMQCRDAETERVGITMTASTNSIGYYHMPIKGDHENEISRDVFDQHEGHARKSSRVTLTNKNGIAGKYRESNALFFLTKNVAPECEQEFKEMEYIPELKDINQA